MAFESSGHNECRQLQSVAGNQPQEQGLPAATSPGDPVIRRPRGRPIGSKNKPKTPPIVLREKGNNDLHPHVFEVASGCDIFNAVAAYSKRRMCGLFVLSGSGMVTNVSLRQPTPAGIGMAGPLLQGRYDILSMTGTFFSSRAPAGATCLTMFMVGPQGQVIGGKVVSAIAAGTVTVVANSFIDVKYDSLPLGEAGESTSAPAIYGGGQLALVDYAGSSMLPSVTLPQNPPPLTADGSWVTVNSAERQAYQ